MDWSAMPRLAAVDFVHIAPAIFKSKGYIFRKENSDKMRLLWNIGLLHTCNYNTKAGIILSVPKMIVSEKGVVIHGIRRFG